jgi:transcription initiation factor TFIIF subunit alpha
VRAHTVNKQHFIGRFLQGMPVFSKKKSDGTKWSLQREGLQGRQLTEALRVCSPFYIDIFLSLFSVIIAF